jgi:CcmD family protein
MNAPDPAPVLAFLAAMQDAPVTRFAAEAAADPEANVRRFRFLIGAFVAVWTILAAYLLTLSVRLRRLSRQVRRLKERAGL